MAMAPPPPPSLSLSLTQSLTCTLFSFHSSMSLTLSLFSRRNACCLVFLLHIFFETVVDFLRKSYTVCIIKGSHVHVCACMCNIWPALVLRSEGPMLLDVVSEGSVSSMVRTSPVLSSRMRPGGKFVSAYLSVIMTLSREVSCICHYD